MQHFFRSLFGQLVMLIVVALLVAQAISIWLFVDERSLAVRAALGFEAAGRAASVARLIEEAPVELHGSILRAANSPLVRFEVSQDPSIPRLGHEDGGAVENRVRALLGPDDDRAVLVDLHEVEEGVLPLPHLSPDMAEMHVAMMRREVSAVELSLSIILKDDRWLNVKTRFERPPLQWTWASTLSFGLTAALILLTAVWFMLRQLTGPLDRLAAAADALGRGEEVNELPASGPSEVRDLTRIFNLMQERLTRFVSDRTRVLAALSHDLRSPLTALRVRAELVDDEENRDSLISSIEEMQDMVEATLSFARGLTTKEPVETVDLNQFLEKLQRDMVGAFSLTTGPDATTRLKPNAIRRALRNLVENANRYAKGARVSFTATQDNIVISVEDSGPGIPEAELEQVFEPFFRLEKSRSLDTGGHGLGLSIARTIIRSHGGDLRLENRREGGLCASIILPRGAKNQTPTEVLM